MTTDAIDPDDVMERIVGKLCIELERKPSGQAQSDVDRMAALETSAVLLRQEIDKQKLLLAKEEAELQKVSQTLAQCELGEDVRRMLAEHRGHNYEAPDEVDQSQITLATEFLNIAQPMQQLRFDTGLVIAGMVLFGGADVLAVGHAMRQRSLDMFGNFNGSMFELIGLSLFTLFLYFLIGLLWHKESEL